MANKIKKGDEVVVISGDHKGSKGKILQVIRAKKSCNRGRCKFNQKART
jgi:ribosomal protein L24